MAISIEVSAKTKQVSVIEVDHVPPPESWDRFRDERETLFARWDGKLARMKARGYPPFVQNEAAIDDLYAQLLAAPETLATLEDGLALIVTAEAQLQTYTNPE